MLTAIREVQIPLLAAVLLGAVRDQGLAGAAVTRRGRGQRSRPRCSRCDLRQPDHDGLVFAAELGLGARR